MGSNFGKQVFVPHRRLLVWCKGIKIDQIEFGKYVKVENGQVGIYLSQVKSALNFRITSYNVCYTKLLRISNEVSSFFI